MARPFLPADSIPADVLVTVEYERVTTMLDIIALVGILAFPATIVIIGVILYLIRSGKI